MYDFRVHYTYDYEKILTAGELEVFRRAIQNNKKVPMSEMGEGVNEVVFRIDDMTTRLLQSAREYTGINSIEKVYKYVSVHERDHHDYWNIVAEERYAFMDINGKMIAHTEASHFQGGKTEIVQVKDKYDVNITNVDSTLEAYAIEYKRKNDLKR